MKVRIIGPNQTEVTVGDVSIFFSYETPVAAHSPKLGWMQDATKYSRTTSRHVNAWLGGVIAAKFSTETFRKEIERAISGGYDSPAPGVNA